LLPEILITKFLEEMKARKNFKAGYVALIGRPNVGKSTLLNFLLNFKLSIVTAKPQTTRKKILGILTHENYQLIFIDTPGLVRPRYHLQEVMMHDLKGSIEDADVVLYMIDTEQQHDKLPDIEKEIFPAEKPVILVLNKIDLIEKKKLLELIDHYRKLFHFHAYIPISALRKDGLDILLDEILTYIPEHPPYFPPDHLTDQPERFFVAEIIREKIYQLFQQEIPYSCHVEVEEFKERENRKDYIRAIIYVDQPSQKSILIGKKGHTIRKLGETARADIEHFLGKSVYLELYVKLLQNWRKKKSSLKNLGY
jgi:GTP-binding protein Era